MDKPRFPLRYRFIVVISVILLAVIFGVTIYFYQISENYSCIASTEKDDDSQVSPDKAKYSLRIYPYIKLAIFNNPSIAAPNNVSAIDSQWADNLYKYGVTETSPSEYGIQKHFNLSKRADGDEDIVGTFDRVSKTFTFDHMWIDIHQQAHTKSIQGECKQITVNHWWRRP